MMKHQPASTLAARLLGTAALACGLLAATSSAQAADTRVGVSVNIAQPGFYGRVDIGDVMPTVIYPQPVIIQQSPIAIQRRPIYLRVPPGHYKQWARYCDYYRACGQPVYFVRYDERRAPRWDERRYERWHEQQHREREERWQDRHERWHDRNDDRGRRDDDRGPGRGNGHGRGHGHH